MVSLKRTAFVLAFFTALLINPASTFSQSFFNKLKDKAKKAVDKTVSAVNGTDDKTDNAKPAASSAPKETGIKSYSKFDFVPGDVILYAEDFSQDATGEFPLGWFTNTSGETVTLENIPGKWLKMKQGGTYLTPVTAFPGEAFTAEFDLILNIPNNNNFPNNFTIDLFDSGKGNSALNEAFKPKNSINMLFEPGSYNRSRAQLTSKENGAPKLSGKKEDIIDFKPYYNTVIHVAMVVQKERFRLWFNENKVFDNPSVAPLNTIFNQMAFGITQSNNLDNEEGFFISNIKIAKGSPDTRSKLITTGKLSTTGITFDVNSDKIKPASAGTLKDIAKTLQENPTIKVKIIGHTDSDGKADANLELSKKRALAVKNELVNTYSIPNTQLETDGKGSSQPVADNATGLGKAKNRRVEFVKM